MFTKLKNLFKFDKKREHEIINDWEILSDNPGRTTMLQSSNPKYPDIIIAQFLYDLLIEKGWKVEMLQSINGYTWLYIKTNFSTDEVYYLLPLLNWLDSESQEGKVRVSTTIQIHHDRLFPKGIFEYQYSLYFDNFRDALTNAFRSWIILDWETLTDAVNSGNAKHMEQMIEMVYGEKGTIKKHLFYGPVVSYPNFDTEKSIKEGTDLDKYIDEFCPCCLFTNSLKAFSKQMESKGENYAIRLFAMKNPDGTLDADCRINGKEYPEAEEYLKKYAETWKDYELVKFRKQYVIIKDSSDVTGIDVIPENKIN